MVLVFPSVDSLSLLEARFTIVVSFTSFSAISVLLLECENVTVTPSIYQDSPDIVQRKLDMTGGKSCRDNIICEPLLI